MSLQYLVVVAIVAGLLGYFVSVGLAVGFLLVVALVALLSR